MDPRVERRFERRAIVLVTALAVAAAVRCGPTPPGGSDGGDGGNGGNADSGAPDAGPDAGPTARCGDGIVQSPEVCDDGNTRAGDGCSARCLLENGFKCPTPGQPCVRTVCGDGIVEGTEACDDGNNNLGDGCTPFCTREPSCTNGVCTSVCGDGVIFPNDTTEQCDDGNLIAGDGCSPTCQIEPYATCVRVTDSPPPAIEIPVVYRDFRGYDLDGGHIDFQNANGSETGIVGTTLGSDSKPVYVKTTSTTTHGAGPFNQWYRDTPGVNLTVVSKLVLDQTDAGTYVFDDKTFFPLDDAGWVALGREPVRPDNTDGGLHNFSFTSEARYWFQYKGTEVLTFRGDDDVWVFINKKLALDLGGVHSAQTGTVDLGASGATLGLADGGMYEVAVFQAERHTSASSYRLTLSNFTAARSECTGQCRDLGLSCTQALGCCAGLECVDAAAVACNGTTACTCQPIIGSRRPPQAP